MDDHRPYGNISKRDHEVKKTDVYWIIAAMILLAFFSCGMFRAPEPQDSQRLVPYKEKIRVDRLLKKHGLLGQVAIIEIHPADGTLWFERKGQLCQLK